MIVYNKSSGLNNSAIGKLETPIKMLIEHESDLISKRGGACDWLFNVERSNRFGESIVVRNDLNTFDLTKEGDAPKNYDTIRDAKIKFIEHIQFMKEFVISAEMLEDANYGIAADAKRRVESFTRAYYKTINMICTQALVNGTNKTFYYQGKNIDISTADDQPLFSSEHVYSYEPDMYQSNFFYGDIFSTGTGSDRKPSCKQFEESLASLAVKIRNMKDENGIPTGYTADTIILPGNRPISEMIVKQVCGSPTVGAYNDINLQYGNWNIVVLPTWTTHNDCLMLMSSEANKNLCGNMFFNRVPLTITNWVDHHTGNYIWNGRCRFGVGFGSYKHILYAVDSEETVSGAYPLDLTL